MTYSRQVCVPGRETLADSVRSRLPFAWKCYRPFFRRQSIRLTSASNQTSNTDERESRFEMTEDEDGGDYRVRSWHRIICSYPGLFARDCAGLPCTALISCINALLLPLLLLLTVTMTFA